MKKREVIGQDASGSTILNKAVQQMLNQYPGLDGRNISFEQLGRDSGIAFSADSGALIISERKDITGHVKQTCSFPFFIVYRTASSRDVQKLHVAEFLDGIGKWVCGETGPLTYPDLGQGRTIKRVTRSNYYGTAPEENGVQDWILPVTVQYQNEFDL